MKKLSYLIVLTLILGLVLTGCLLSNVGQVPTSEQSGITYLTKNGILNPDLVGLWRFNGNADDSSSNGNNGIVHGGATYDPSPMGQALSFDGEDDYVGCGNDASLNITQAITIEAWVKPSAFPTSADYSTIATKARAYYFQVDGSGYLRVYQYGTSLPGYHSSTNPISLNVWQHVAYTYDGSNVRMFINGVLDKTIPVTGIIRVSNMQLGIGMNLDASGNPYPNFYRQFQGEIDEVRIWNTALTAEQLIRYGFIGLLAPYKEPPRAFKIGSSIPLKWHYTDSANEVVDSSAASPSVEIKPAASSGSDTSEPAIVVNDPGLSGLRYDSSTDMWIYNWQTKEKSTGFYNIRITSGQTNQVNGPFLIRLR